MSASARSPARAVAGGVRLAVRLTPKARADAVGQWLEVGGEAVLSVRVRAAPDRGAANAALLRTVADWLGVPLSRVSLAAGGRSRRKSVAVAGDPEDLLRRIEGLAKP